MFKVNIILPDGEGSLVTEKGLEFNDRLAGISPGIILPGKEIHVSSSPEDVK